MSSVRSIAVSMRAGIFFTLTPLVLIALAFGLSAGIGLAAPRYTTSDIRALLAMYPLRGLNPGDSRAETNDWAEISAEFTDRLFGSGFVTGTAIFRSGELVYANGVDSPDLMASAREASRFPLALDKFILGGGKAYYLSPISPEELGDAVLLLQLASFSKPWRHIFTQVLDNLSHFPPGGFFPAALILITLMLCASVFLTWLYLTRPLSQTLSILEILDLSESAKPQGTLAQVLAPALIASKKRMVLREDTEAKNTQNDILGRQRMYTKDSFAASAAYMGTAFETSSVGVDQLSDGRHVFSLLDIQGKNGALLATVCASRACISLANSSAESAAFLNRYLRHEASGITAQAGYIFWNPLNRKADFCLLGKARLLRYDQRNKLYQGFDQGQAALGSMDPSDFDGRLGYSQLAIEKGETLFLVSGDLDWEDLIKQVLKKAETEAEKHQFLLALLRQRCDEQMSAIALMISFA
ncbi:MAG: hypothetical protein LBC99_06180 [Spirochaetota bacterium]|jgi:hypothetical protein|nr:hypothetical protein [Spirochaetota bacterium]